MALTYRHKQSQPVDIYTDFSDYLKKVGEYADLTDDQGYVFGNESSSFYMIRFGFQMQF